MKRMHCSSKRLIRMTTRISNHLMYVQPTDIMKTLYMACTYVPKKKTFSDTEQMQISSYTILHSSYRN